MPSLSNEPKIMIEDLSRASDGDIRPAICSRRWKLALVLVLVLFTGLVSLGILVAVLIFQRFGSEISMFLGDEYVPQKEGILRSSTATFVIEPSSVRGYIGTIDLPTMLFQYTVPGKARNAAGEVFLEIEDRAKRDGWKVLDRNEDEMRFERSYREASYWCVESVRIRLTFDDEDTTVFVCWTVGDSDRPNVTIEESFEGRWVSSDLWPRFDEWVETSRTGRRDDRH